MRSGHRGEDAASTQTAASGNGPRRRSSSRTRSRSQTTMKTPATMPMPMPTPRAMAERPSQTRRRARSDRRAAARVGNAPRSNRAQRRAATDETASTTANVMMTRQRPRTSRAADQARRRLEQTNEQRVIRVFQIRESETGARRQILRRRINRGDRRALKQYKNSRRWSVVATRPPK